MASALGASASLLWTPRGTEPENQLSLRLGLYRVSPEQGVHRAGPLGGSPWSLGIPCLIPVLPEEAAPCPWLFKAPLRVGGEVSFAECVQAGCLLDQVIRSLDSTGFLRAEQFPFQRGGEAEGHVPQPPALRPPPTSRLEWPPSPVTPGLDQVAEGPAKTGGRGRGWGE